MTYDSFFKKLALEVRDIASVDFDEAEIFVEKKLGVDQMNGDEFEAFINALDQNSTSLQKGVIAQAEELAIRVCQTKSEAKYLEQLRGDFSTANRN